MAIIVGPTASGKSALALALAADKNGVVINADSAQVYRDLSVLSAKPTAEEMAQAPHRLYGYIDGAEACSAARWANDAKTEIATATSKGQLPILVGGTGLYVRTLLDGIAPIPEIDPVIRAVIRQLPVADAYSQLSISDPEAAERLNPADSTRIARALEVVRSTGDPMHVWQQRKSGGISGNYTVTAIVLTPPRDWLFERCDRRVDVMMAQGAVEEVRNLLARNLPIDCPVRRAIGVPEIAEMLNGNLSEEDAVERLKTSTRQYAKRQYTWFRNQPPDDWHRWAETISNDNVAEIIRLFH